MKQIQHFFVDCTLKESELTLTDKDLLNQIKNVLRFRTNDECFLHDNNGTMANAKVLSINRDFAKFLIDGKKSFPRSKKLLRLYIAIPKKPATLELIIQKATELLVDEIIPIDTFRCQVHSLYKADRLKAIAKEASEQCERKFLPKVEPLLKFEDFIKNPPDGLILAGDPFKYDKKLCEMDFKKEIINIVIGPEGGLTDDELFKIQRINGKLFLLGETVLRMETAAISALSIVQFT